MATAHRNAAINTLDTQLKREYPGITIGWIADGEHSSRSQHQKDSDGSVDAIDPMLGPAFAAGDAWDIWDVIIDNRDPRLWCMIWWGHIVSGHDVWQDGVFYPAWTPRPYHGTSDPHTGHMHIETTQALETNSKEWKLTMRIDPADINAIANRAADLTEDRIATRLGLAKLGGRTVGGSINNLIEWGLTDHPVDKTEPTK